MPQYKTLTSFLSLLYLATCLSLSSCTPPDPKPEQPNIILIYADDLGKGLLSHEGQLIIHTPNIDRLAAEGMRMENAYAPMLCAPSRATLITGRHDCHAQGFAISNAGIYKKINTEGKTPDEVEDRINATLPEAEPDELFLGQMARDAGYVTAQFGKLEWGFATSRRQMQRHGWTHYLGYLDHIRAHGFYPPFLFSNGRMVHFEGNTRADCGKSMEPETPEAYAERWDMKGKALYAQDIFMDSLLRFMEVQEEPFFIYFPTQLPHGPVAIPEVHPDFANDARLTPIEKEYASMVKRLDDDVGRILEKLEALGIDGNTLLIFTSDNGHEIYYAQEGRTLKPYTNMESGERFDDLDRKYYSELAGDVFNGNGGRAGMKRSNLQGGIEVPLIMRWPDHIKPGCESQMLVASYDLLPTLADVCGYEGSLPDDGLSFYPELLGKGEVAAHDFVVFSSFTGPTLITREGWKLRSYLPKDTFELFYLPDDYREENNLSASRPERLSTLKKQLLKACDGDLENGWYRPQSSQIAIE